MARRTISFLVALACGMLAASAAQAADTVTVLCASASTDAMHELVPLFERSHPGVTIQPLFGGPQVLAAQIEADGSVADVLLVGETTTKALAAKLGGPIPIFRYGEAVLVPRNSTKVRELRDLARSGVRVALGITGSPFRGYADTVLSRASADYGKTFAADVDKNVTLTRTSDAALRLAVANGLVDAAIGFTSDAGGGVDAIRIPAQFDVVTTTYATPLKAAPHAAIAKDFVAYLAGPEAQAIFRKHHLDAPH
jgi:molybdate transport system substrate-binding protein